MKQFFTTVKNLKVKPKRGLMVVAFLLFIINASAQPGFDFQNPVRISGADLAVGTSYRFSNVTTGTDAIVNITGSNGGAYLTALDDVANGYLKALQPIVHVNANSNGYVTLRIDFVNTGTNTARIMTQLPVTLLDVDAATFGGENIYEYDDVQALAGYSIEYDSNTELNVSVASNWARGINVPASEYLGIDTLATKVMYTVVNYNRSTVSVRLGANNTTNQFYNRLKSVYFKTFVYAFSTLGCSLTDFKAFEQEKNIELEWKLAADCGVKNISVEKRENASTFKSIGEIIVSSKPALNNLFRFEDRNVENVDNYYRLKMIHEDGKVEYSNILHMRSKSTKEMFKVYPSLVQSSTTVMLKSDATQKALLQIVDYAGNVVYHENINLLKGNNSLSINQLDHLKKGIYLVTVKVGNRILTERISKQ